VQKREPVGTAGNRASTCFRHNNLAHCFPMSESCLAIRTPLALLEEEGVTPPLAQHHPSPKMAHSLFQVCVTSTPPGRTSTTHPCVLPPLLHCPSKTQHTHSFRSGSCVMSTPPGRAGTTQPCVHPRLLHHCVPSLLHCSPALPKIQHTHSFRSASRVTSTPPGRMSTSL
jgi:hypothetical protein